MENRVSMQTKQQSAAVSQTVVSVPSLKTGYSDSLDLSTHKRDHRPHAIVVGAGLGGLSAAIHLVRDGWRVTVLEKNGRCGGRMNMIEEEGFRIDMGPTLLMMPEVLQGIFQACGCDINDYLDLRRLDPAYRIRFADGSHFDMQGSVEALRAEAARLLAGGCRKHSCAVCRDATAVRECTLQLH